MSKYCRRKRVYEARCDLASQRSQMAPLRDHSCKVCIKSPCTVSTALLALIEVHGLLIQTLLFSFYMDGLGLDLIPGRFPNQV